MPINVKVLQRLSSWQEDSIGHYVDLSSVVLGCTLFPVGYFVCTLRGRPSAATDTHD
jgi:hypothetical protein